MPIDRARQRELGVLLSVAAHTLDSTGPMESGALREALVGKNLANTLNEVLLGDGSTIQSLPTLLAQFPLVFEVSAGGGLPEEKWIVSLATGLIAVGSARPTVRSANADPAPSVVTYAGARASSQVSQFVPEKGRGKVVLSALPQPFYPGQGRAFQPASSLGPVPSASPTTTSLQQVPAGAGAGELTSTMQGLYVSQARAFKDGGSQAGAPWGIGAPAGQNSSDSSAGPAAQLPTDDEILGGQL